MLRIGPRSAEANPGPACYGLGGKEPTVTDANVVLGYFNQESLLGGRKAIVASLATEAIRHQVAEPLGLEPREAALAIYTVVNDNMANAVHRSSTEQGYDLREFTLVCGGGCSAAHAARVAQTAGIGRVVVPRVSAALCSFGAAVTTVRHDYATSYHARFSVCDPVFMEQAFVEMTLQAAEDLRQENFASSEMQLERHMDIRYVGELGDLSLAVPTSNFTWQILKEMEESFHQLHERTYTFADRSSECEIMGLSLVARGKRRSDFESLQLCELAGTGGALKTNQRDVLFAEGVLSVNVYQGDLIEINGVIDGPAIVEESTTTLVLPPGWQVRLDACHAWVMSYQG